MHSSASELTTLNFPVFSFRVKESDRGRQIFDPIRKKFVALSPEEWVRQHVIRLFIETLAYPATLISVEKSFVLSGSAMRYDIVVFNREHQPAMIVECKQPDVTLTAATVEQVTRYNLFSKAGRVYITNGLTHYLYKVDFEKKSFENESGFPAFDIL
jgi:hypothetical protein